MDAFAARVLAALSAARPAAAVSGGSVTAVEPPDPDGELVAVGGTPGTPSFVFDDVGGRIDSYSATLTALNGSGTPSVSDGGADDSAGPWTLAGGVAGGSYLLSLDALDGDGNVIATAQYMWAFAEASGGPADIVKFADIGDYDFMATGGTGGTGGAGPHTLPDGTTCTVYEVGTGPTQAEFISGKLVGDGDASNYYVVEFDLGSDTKWVPIWIMGQWTLGETADVGTLKLWTSETAGETGNLADDLQVLSISSSAMRFRFQTGTATANTILDVTSLDLDDTDQFEFLLRAHANAWSTVEGRQGVGTLPQWSDAVMSNVSGGVRASAESFRRYLRVRVGAQDASLDLHVQKGL